MSKSKKHKKGHKKIESDISDFFHHNSSPGKLKDKISDIKEEISDIFSPDKHSSKKHSKDKYSSKKYSIDKYSSKKFSCDKFSSKKFSCDKFSSKKICPKKIHSKDISMPEHIHIDKSKTIDKYVIPSHHFHHSCNICKDISKGDYSMHHYSSEMRPDYDIHQHSYRGVTSTNHYHRHRFYGTTSPTIQTSHGHIHYYQGETSFSMQHNHYYHGWTGPAIPVHGGHIHFYQGVTTSEDGHVHYFRGYTYHES